jgi:hypothetical protein
VDGAVRTALPKDLRLALIHHKKYFFKGGLTLRWHPRSQPPRTTSSKPRSLPYSPWNKRTKCPPPPNDHDKAQTS